jgi:hypothetical protein
MNIEALSLTALMSLLKENFKSWYKDTLRKHKSEKTRWIRVVSEDFLRSGIALTQKSSP